MYPECVVNEVSTNTCANCYYDNVNVYIYVYVCMMFEVWFEYVNWMIGIV